MCVCLYVSVCADICPENTVVQAEIVDKHNAFRRAVQPPASDMLKMVSPAFSRTIKVEQIIFANNSQRLFSLTCGKEKNNEVGEVVCTTPENHKSLFKIRVV